MQNPVGSLYFGFKISTVYLSLSSPAVKSLTGSSDYISRFTDIYWKKNMQQIIIGKKIKIHLVFCITVLVLFYAGAWSLNAAGFVFGKIPLMLMRFLFFLWSIYTGRWLCQSWYLKNKLVLFLLFIFIACFTITITWWFLIKYCFNYPYAGIIEVIVSIMPFFVIGVVMGILLKLARATMQQQIQDEQAKTAQKQSELSLLQSQLSPHFLFNTLNNLYGISITQHERLPGLLLKLSELLRYAVYDTKIPFVPLREEIDYISNYIDFEKIRISDRLLLTVEIETGIHSTIKVAPMVLIVFIENAFKHAKNTQDQKIYIAISLAISDKFVVFTVSNSYSTAANIKHNTVLNVSSGLGLSNTIKRLDLLYGTDYLLKKFAKDDVYTIQLSLPVKQ